MASPNRRGASDRLNDNRKSDMGALHEALNYVKERIQDRAIE